MNRNATETFAVELEGWLYGLQAFRGKMYPALVQQVIKELAPALTEAVNAGVQLDLIVVAGKFLSSANGVITERALIHHLLVQIPDPRGLDEERQYILAVALNQVEGKFQGLVASAQQAWKAARQGAASARIAA